MRACVCVCVWGRCGESGLKGSRGRTLISPLKERSTLRWLEQFAHEDGFLCANARTANTNSCTVGGLRVEGSLRCFCFGRFIRSASFIYQTKSQQRPLMCDGSDFVVRIRFANLLLV